MSPSRFLTADDRKTAAVTESDSVYLQAQQYLLSLAREHRYCSPHLDQETTNYLLNFVALCPRKMKPRDPMSKQLRTKVNLVLYPTFMNRCAVLMEWHTTTVMRLIAGLLCITQYGSRIKRCTCPSVRPSVCPVTTRYCRRRKAIDATLDTSNR